MAEKEKMTETSEKPSSEAGEENKPHARYVCGGNGDNINMDI